MASAASCSNDWTTCPICMEVFTNPKALPCIHGFCLRCLQRYYQNNLPGDVVPCPLCKKLFAIPRDGLDGLQHHFLIQHLVDTRIRLTDTVTTEAVQELISWLPEAAISVRQKVEKDCEDIQSAINAVQQQSETQKLEALAFTGKLVGLENEVTESGEAIKRMVDTRIAECLAELRSAKSESAQQFESVQEQLQMAMTGMQSFHEYSRELLDKGSPSDVALAARELHTKATELLNNDVVTVQYCPPDVSFTPADITQLTSSQVIGEVTIRFINRRNSPVTEEEGQDGDSSSEADDLSSISMTPTPVVVGRIVHTLLEESSVWGVTSLRNLLYVLCNRVSQEVSVYDLDFYHLQDRIHVPHLDAAADITACPHNRCLYIAGHVNIYRVAFAHDHSQSDYTVTEWPVYHGEPYGLSVTNGHTLLVSCYGVGKIKEFNTRGKLLRVIQMPQYMASLWHTIWLPRGELLACCGSSADRLSIHSVRRVTMDGVTVKAFGGARGSGTEQMYTPMHMAVDSNGCVFVADCNNCRVLLLSPDLTYSCEFLSREDLREKPQKLFLDEDKRRLYVALRSGHVVVTSVDRL